MAFNMSDLWSEERSTFYNLIQIGLINFMVQLATVGFVMGVNSLIIIAEYYDLNLYVLSVIISAIAMFADDLPNEEPPLTFLLFTLLFYALFATARLIFIADKKIFYVPYCIFVNFICYYAAYFYIFSHLSPFVIAMTLISTVVNCYLLFRYHMANVAHD